MIAEVEDRRLVGEAHLEAELHHAVVGGEVARQVRVLQEEPVWILEVDRLGPLVIDDRRDPDALRDQLGALRFELRVAAGLEREVVDALGVISQDVVPGK